MTAFFTDTAPGLFNYWVVIALMMIGFYTVIAHDNLVKKLIGLNVFQTSVFILYISMGKIHGATAPILLDGPQGDHAVYAHPLPQVLILTAIVVGVSTTALGLALIVRIHEAYGSIEEDDVLAADFATQDIEQAEEAARSRAARAAEPHAPTGRDDGAEPEERRPQ
ncbi:cation:proton antiporter subunit C [Salinisphaera sp. LB1]|uniref:cation:proton antiporter subunit C n=1 Tax=Salinisphaera sp. LB1 TaxID=2183911 RepID=UPI000D705F82|nr:cation:proton antiporter subunit C [Salinisphaera sp. LB1]AWN16641.1 PH adaptation potassium efflux system protein C [Salinisphaera sp. LB1]